jgi:solute carrier family 35 protein F1/2
VKALSNWGWLRYLLLGLVDVEANFMIVMAYQYASITSVQLLDNFTVPAVMVLSLLLLNLQYRPTHIVGACVCVTGVVTMVLNDYFTKVRMRIRRQPAHVPVRFRSLADSFRHASWMSCPQGDTDAANALLGDFLVIGAATLYAVSNVAQACGACYTCYTMPAVLVLSGYRRLVSRT